jgi:hypothetical protein
MQVINSIEQQLVQINRESFQLEIHSKDLLEELGGIESLVNFLVQNTCSNSNYSPITHLSLCWTRIQTDQVKCIAKALIQYNPNLTVISFEGNQIGDQGTEAISTLQEIYLNNDRIGKQGAKFIADAIKMNSMLYRVSI